ncbi:MAG: DUF6340 family protein [Chitinispirillaceae bacterium]
MKLKVMAMSCLSLLLFNCATTIPVEVLKPAELNMPPVKKIAIMDPDLTGNWSFWFDNDNESVSLQDLAVKVVQKQLGMESDSRPDPKTAYPGSEFSTKLISSLVQNGHYTVLERAELNSILEEHQLGMSGMMDESQTAEIGKMAGVEAILVGSGTYDVKDNGDWKESKKVNKRKIMNSDSSYTTVYDTVVVRKFHAVRNVNMEVTFRVVGVESGQVVASATNRDHVQLKSVKKNETDAFKNLPNWSTGVQRCTDRLVDRTVRQIAPYYVTQRRKIMKGKSTEMKTALEYAKRNVIEDAREIWEKTARITDPERNKDRIAATYNMGVYWELRGELQKADECFETCFKVSGKKNFLDDRQRVKARIKEMERLRSQDASMQ